ncbi:hypothetical protein C8Q73DRAFT_3393 [Cubamyces lactineus]|nr:hypothetical protein C8Q73DRAFT_3393 [Cubamyces lactineus]
MRGSLPSARVPQVSPAHRLCLDPLRTPSTISPLLYGLDVTMSSGSLIPSGLALPKIPALDNTYGVMMLGTFIGLILYGVNLHQSYRYVRSAEFKYDSIYVKVMVTIVLLLETLHSVTSMHTVYYYVVRNYFNPLVLFHGVCFFARRLWMINHKFRPLVAFVAVLLMAEAALSTAVTVEAFIQPDIVHFENYSWMVSAGLGVILLADALLTTLLIITLRHSRTGFHSTEQMLNTLITYTICTGLLTDTLTILSFAMAIRFPHTLLADGMNMKRKRLNGAFEVHLAYVPFDRRPVPFQPAEHRELAGGAGDQDHQRRHARRRRWRRHQHPGRCRAHRILRAQ